MLLAQCSSDFPSKAENKSMMLLNNLPIIVAIKIIIQSAVTFLPLTLVFPWIVNVSPAEINRKKGALKYTVQINLAEDN